MGAVDLVVDLIRGRRTTEVVVVADHDEPGRHGAHRLAAAVAPYVPLVRIMTPPDGIKDAREWVRTGETSMDMVAHIDHAPKFELQVVGGGS